MEIHAHLRVASSLEAAAIDEDLKREGPDTRHVVTDSFGIDEARALIANSSRRPLGGGKHRFVIVTRSLTVEAQNALLKLFEDPPADTHFYLIVPHESALIPTLRSRLIEEVTTKNAVDLEATEEFLDQDIRSQLESLADLAKRQPERLTSLAKEIGLSRPTKLRPNSQRALLLTLKYVYNRGASRKMLLENLILSMQEKVK
jgi:DNA polymerase III delta prime subunit